MKFWNGDIVLPLKERMLEEFRVEKERRKEVGKSIRKSHLLSVDQVSFFFRLMNHKQFISLLLNCGIFCSKVTTIEFHSVVQINKVESSKTEMY